MYDRILYQVKYRSGNRASLQKIWKSHSIPISTKIRLMKAVVWRWPVATYGCESWTLRKNEKTRIESFEMKGLRKILHVSLDSKENKLVGSQQSWSKEGTVRHCQSKEASILWSHHEETRELPEERNNARNNARNSMHCLDRPLSHGQDSLWKSQSE